jgi:sulfate adenylyltransferase subunit 1
MNQSVAQQIAEQGGVEAWLQAQQHKSLLRFLTCGSVDDGKSTLIGRLLHDTRQIYEDQLANLQTDSRRHGTQGEKLDLALLVDGLQAEREQRITIDVAYRYFSTEQRKFIIADTPGHEQYTRNMATGASTCDAAIVLIDARKGVLNQTRRHSFIATLLGIRQVIVAINKMDLVRYQEAVFNEIRQQYQAVASLLPSDLTIHFIPISALEGDNIVANSKTMPWYQGPALLQLLERMPVTAVASSLPLRFSVQYVNRPDLNFRGYAGTVAGGTMQVGQQIKVLPAGTTSHIQRIVTFDAERTEAQAGEAITLVLTDEIDISRGDMVVDVADNTSVVRQAEVDVVWMATEPLTLHQPYLIKLSGKLLTARVTAFIHQVDINSLETQACEQLALNGIGRVQLTFDEPVFVDSYRSNAKTGSLIFIDRISNNTVAAGLVVQPLATAPLSKPSATSAFELELNALIRKHFPHWQAIDISGKNNESAS